ncbi:MAG: CCA tRNA nucleotidyltransferase [Bryobacteraceae bacterium]
MTRRALALKIVRELRARGHQAFLVGGCVRDRLLGIEPKDYDVSTDAPPHTVLSYFPQSQPVGAHFGVILVGSSGGTHVEVATFRSEGGYADGRRPEEVHFELDPRLDVMRRDFTINGLMEDPISGEILDFCGGQPDLRDGIVRAIGDARVRFEEDHLRMLRAVRFAARLHFRIEPVTMAAVQEQAPAIHRISAERTRDELIRILTEGDARRGLELLDESGLLTEVLPEVKAYQGVAQPAEFHPEGDVWIHTLMMLAKLDRPSVALAFGVLLHDVGKPPTFRVADRIRFDGHAEVGAQIAARILTRLKFSNDQIDQIVALVANHMRFKDVMQMRPSTLKRFLRRPDFEEHLELHRLDTQASNGYTAAYDFVRDQLGHLGEEELRPRRFINGKDLIEAGYQPGPLFSKALEAVETAQLEGEISTKDEAMARARAVLDNEQEGL